MDTDTGSESKGLDAILTEAIDANYVDPSQPAEAPQTEAAPEAPKETAGTDRPRDERGRFAPTDAKPSDGPAEASPTVVEAQTDPALKPVEAPRNFTADQKAQFAKLNREVQEWVATIEREREAVDTRRSQEAAELKRTAEPFLNAIAPYRQYLEQIAPQVRQTPDQMIGAILSAEHTLRTGNPQQKAQAFAQLAQQYQVDLAALTGGQQAAYHQPQQPAFDPYAQRLTALEQRLQQEREEQQARETSIQIDNFKNAKDETGQPKYPHFERLRSAMALSLANNEVATLDEAYAKAYGPIKELVESEVAARQTAAEKERAAAIDKAKKAAPVKSSTGTLPRGYSQPKGLDAILKSNLDRVFG